MTDLSAEFKALAEYRPTNKVRFVTAASLFDGHDAAINIMRRILQGMGAEVNHFRPHALQDAPHDVDGGVMPVEEAGRGDEAHLVRRAVVRERLVLGGEVGHGFVSCVVLCRQMALRPL